MPAAAIVRAAERDAGGGGQRPGERQRAVPVLRANLDA